MHVLSSKFCNGFTLHMVAIQSRLQLMGTCTFHLVVLIWYRLKLRFSSSSYHIHSSMVSVKLLLFFSSVNVEGLIKSMTISFR